MELSFCHSRLLRARATNGHCGARAGRLRSDRVCAQQVLIYIALALFSLPLSAIEPVIIFTYHIHPPFIVSPGNGLTFDLADYLTEKSHGRYQFEVAPMSRPRLDTKLTQSIAGIVPWVDPSWFKDRDRTKFLWTEAHLMRDTTVIVSAKGKSVTYQGPESLEGLRFGGIRGHVYAGIDAAVGKRGPARRVDSDSHTESFQKLLNGLIDVTLLPGSSASYFIKRNDAAAQVFISPEPHSHTVRRVLVLNKRQDVLELVQSVLAQSQDDPAWAKIRDRYE